MPGKWFHFIITIWNVQFNKETRNLSEIKTNPIETEMKFYSNFHETKQDFPQITWKLVAYLHVGISCVLTSLYVGIKLSFSVWLAWFYELDNKTMESIIIKHANVAKSL